MTLLILNSKGYERSEDFTVEFHKPLRFKKMALQFFSIWVSWNNISEKYNNNRFSFFDGNVWTDMTIPDGNYTLRELNDFMVKYFREDDPPIKFGVVFARQRFVIKLKEHYRLDLTKSKLHEVLGFEPMTFEDEEQEGRFVANISRSVDDIHIHCNVIEGAYLNEYTSEIIYSFTPSNPPGSLIAKEFDKPVFFHVKTSPVYRIRMRVTNQDGEPLELNQQKVLYRLAVE